MNPDEPEGRYPASREEAEEAAREALMRASWRHHPSMDRSIDEIEDLIQGDTPGERLANALGLGPEWHEPADRVIAEMRADGSLPGPVSSEAIEALGFIPPTPTEVARAADVADVAGAAELADIVGWERIEMARPMEISFPIEQHPDWTEERPLRAEPVPLHLARPATDPVERPQGHDHRRWRKVRRYVRAALRGALRGSGRVS